MKRRSQRRSASAFLALSLALVLGSCGGLGKKDASASGGATDATTEEAGKKEGGPEEASTQKPNDTPTEQAGPEAGKPDGRNPAGGEKPPTGSATAEPAADPLAAEEFAGLPKGEPSFILACRALAAGGKSTMTGKDGHVFDTRDLEALAAHPKTGTPRHQGMVAAITAHAESLRAAGVELIIAPVTPKPVIYPDYLGGESEVKDRRYDAYLQALYAELEKAGVRVVDTTRSLRSDRSRKYAASYPRSGILWSPAAAATTAKAIHSAVRKTEAAKSLARDKTILSRDTSITQNGETFRARSVGWAQGDRLVPATVPEQGAPIVVIGDEHAPAHRDAGINASLADQLSLVFGVPVETQAVPGLGWKEAAAFVPAKDSPTRLVVWSFSATRFFDAPAPEAKKPARPRRTSSRSSDRGEDLPARNTGTGGDPGAGLRLRDDPGLEGRSE